MHKRKYEAIEVLSTRGTLGLLDQDKVRPVKVRPAEGLTLSQEKWESICAALSRLHRTAGGFCGLCYTYKYTPLADGVRGDDCGKCPLARSDDKKGLCSPEYFEAREKLDEAWKASAAMLAVLKDTSVKKRVKEDRRDQSDRKTEESCFSEALQNA